MLICNPQAITQQQTSHFFGIYILMIQNETANVFCVAYLKNLYETTFGHETNCLFEFHTWHFKELFQTTVFRHKIDLS